MKLRGLPQAGSIRTLLARTAPGNDSGSEFSLELDRQENPQQVVRNPAVALQEEASVATSSNSSGEKRLIRLGAITPKTPTVSHLLIRNPDYQKRCWELIYAAQNKDKPYKEIPFGKTIYFDPAKEEILWDDKEAARNAALASHSYRSISDIKAAKPVPGKNPMAGNIAEPTADGISNRPATVSCSEKTCVSPDGPQSLGKVLVKKVRHYIGTPYKRLNCFELVVEGLRKMGIQYGGKDGLQQRLIRRAREEQLPANAYLTGDGLIEASGNSIYTKSFTGLRQPEQKAEEIWHDIELLLESGMMISFSAGRRGHTGIVARHEDEWTFINSGYMDNDIHSATRRKRVGEENLKQEISNWLRLAYVGRKPLRINLGRLDTSKVAAYQGESDRAELPVDL